MKSKMMLLSLVIFSALFLSAFAAPAASPDVKRQSTVVPPATIVVTPAVTLIPPTVAARATPRAIPVTSGPNPVLWSILLFGLLAMLVIAFLVALFSPRPAAGGDDADRNPPRPPDV